MARIAGVDLPKQKRIIIALTYIFGIGKYRSRIILKKANINEDVRVKELSENEILTIRDLLSKYIIEGNLTRQVSNDIRRLKEIGSYRGSRHRKKLPCRGQRTHTNARTKKGKRIAIAGKKKVTK